MSPGQITGFDWLPALTRVRESAVMMRGAPLSMEAVESLLSRLDIGGEIAMINLD